MAVEKSPNIPPFVRFCTASVPMVFDNSMSYYECLCALTKFIQTDIINVVNNNADVLADYEAKVKALKEYVDHYFDNLDVQTEINNKLDAMVEDGTMAEIINEEIFNELDAKVDAAKEVTDQIVLEDQPFTYNYLYAAGDGFGNSLVITGDKNIIIDFGDRAGIVNNYLISNNITKLDAIVLTHYHSDHAGGLSAQGLIEVINNSSIDFSDCTVYLPHKGIDWTQVTTADKSTLMATENAVKSALTTAGITYYEPNNEEKVDLSTLTSLEFYNIGASFYENYYSVDTTGMTGTTDYNAFSMLVKVTHNGISEFETGDITPVGQKYNAKYLTDVAIYHSFHHGTYTPLAKEWAIKLNPDYCIVTKNIATTVADNADIEVCGAKKATIYDVKDAQQTISLVQTGKTIKCNSQYTNIKLDMAITSRPAVMLEAGTDLDDIVDDGCYYSPNAAQSLTMSNCPPCVNRDHTQAGNVASFRLDVIKKGSYGGNNRLVKQILSYNNVGVTFMGTWYREIQGYTDTWTAWAYIAPEQVEGSHTIGDAYAFGTVSGDNKYLNLCIVSRGGTIPAALKLVNGVMSRCNLKGIGGVVAYAGNDGEAAGYETTFTANTSGIYISIHKTNNGDFGTANTPVCGTLTYSYDLEKY